jgi:DNA-binding beta-propeller fold protein YncE
MALHSRFTVSLLLLTVCWVVLHPAPLVTAQDAAPFSCGGSATPEAIPPAAAPSPAASPSSSSGSILNLKTDVPLPGDPNRFDYQSFDPQSGRLYIAHMDSGQLIVVDTASESVIGTVDNLPAVTGVLAVPDLGSIYAAVTGNHEVVAIDANSLQVTAHLGPIDFPDGLDYSPDNQSIYVSDESGGGELVIDASTNTIVTTIDIGGEAGNTHYDAGSGCVLVAVQDKGLLVAIDPRTNQVADRLELGGDCKGPHGFALDSERRLAFVSCEDNATLLTVDLSSMAVTQSTQVGDHPDVLAFDPGWRRLYVASESGTVDVFDERGNELESVGRVEIPHAHSVAVDPSTHLVYFPLENIDGQPVLRVMTSQPPTEAGA